MILYRILVKHFAPRDSHTSTEGYVACENTEQLLDRLVAQDNIYWDEEGFLEEDLEVYDDDYKLTGTETRRELYLRVGGELYDPDADTSDAYYGVTHYGWEEVGTVTEEEVKTFERLGILLKESTDE